MIASSSFPSSSKGITRPKVGHSHVHHAMYSTERQKKLMIKKTSTHENLHKARIHWKSHFRMEWFPLEMMEVSLSAGKMNLMKEKMDQSIRGMDRTTLMNITIFWQQKWKYLSNVCCLCNS